MASGPQTVHHQGGCLAKTAQQTPVGPLLRVTWDGSPGLLGQTPGQHLGPNGPKCKALRQV